MASQIPFESFDEIIFDDSFVKQLPADPETRNYTRQVEHSCYSHVQPAPGAAPGSRARPPNPLHTEVYSLKDAGKDLNDICNATGLEKGEVELILGLRKMPPA